ncbi:MAG: N-acetylmuramoyl-L-alanine amidase [Lachnospiraceae bacterium]|nr:N-acetylmuramoyl-L-alanine amidase [Lachnospiraceae bacterium]
MERRIKKIIAYIFDWDRIFGTNHGKRTRRQMVIRNRRFLFTGILLLTCIISYNCGRISNKRKYERQIDDLVKQLEVAYENDAKGANLINDEAVPAGSVPDENKTEEQKKDKKNEDKTEEKKRNSDDKKSLGTVVIDAGHGGIMAGADYGGILEKDLVLTVSGKVAAKLLVDGYSVVELRTSDVDISLSERASLANKTIDAAAFVSVHANSYVQDSSVNGIVTYYHPKKEQFKNLAYEIQKEAAELTGASDRGILAENYQVLRDTNMSSALIEIGYMTNNEELSKLKDDEYQNKLAEGIAKGIENYLNSDDNSFASGN